MRVGFGGLKIFGRIFLKLGIGDKRGGCFGKWVGMNKGMRDGLWGRGKNFGGIFLMGVDVGLWTGFIRICR